MSCLLSKLVKQYRVNYEESQLPTLNEVGDLYYSKTNDGKSHIFINKNQCEKKILEPGKRGTFDDSGVMPSCVVKDKLYYTGWNTNKSSVNYRHGIGVLLNNERIYNGPVLDRTLDVPYLCNSPCVLFFDEFYHMWFCNGTGWIDDFPTYGISYAKSCDGFLWCVNKNIFGGEKEAWSRPCVKIIDNKFYMWCSIKEKNTNYQIFEFSSDNAFEWTLNGKVLILKEDWNSEMNCYPWIVKIDNTIKMFFNGNGFGKTGIGCCVYEI